MTEEEMRRETERMAAEAGVSILRDEEDEWEYGPLLDRARARAAELGGEDGKLIAELVALAEYIETERDAIYWSASDAGELAGCD
jgi:hypothetical protein